MSGVVEGILGQLGPSGLSEIATSLGADQGMVESAASAALPAIIAGMAKNSQQPQGAESLSKALGDHSPSIFDALGPILAGGGDGGKILGHILGSNQKDVGQNISGQSGLDLGLVMKLLPILAPLVMGYLSKEKEDKGLDAGGLGSMLDQERSDAESKQPGLGGLAAILDGDGDGSIVDDILGKFS